MKSEQEIDCVAYDPGLSFSLGKTPQGTTLASGKAHLCFHPDVIENGDDTAFCGLGYGEKECPHRTPNGSTEGERLQQLIEARQEKRKRNLGGDPVF